MLLIFFCMKPKSTARSPLMSASSKRSVAKQQQGRTGKYSAAKGSNNGRAESAAASVLSSGDTGDDMLIGELLCKFS